MSQDLFGLERFEEHRDYTQRDLLGGVPTLAAGRRCPTCGLAYAKTESGFLTCPRGHETLNVPDNFKQSSIDGMPVPHWTRKGTA